MKGDAIVQVVLGVISAAFLSVAVNPASAQPVQTVPMIRFDGGPLPPWAQGMLRRDADAGVVTMNIHSKAGGELFELGEPQGTNWKPGDVITNWFINFNNPAMCTAPCDLDDVLAAFNGNPAQVGVHFATGHVTTSARWSSSASLLVGDDTNLLFGVPLDDAETSELHGIVRSHGPASALSIQELLDALSTINGGCANVAPPEGPNVCGDPQFAVFPALP